MGPSEIKALRERLGLERTEASELVGQHKNSWRDWELSRRHPTGAAEVLLRLLSDRPALLRELRRYVKEKAG